MHAVFQERMKIVMKICLNSGIDITAQGVRMNDHDFVKYGYRIGMCVRGRPLVEWISRSGERELASKGQDVLRMSTVTRRVGEVSAVGTHLREVTIRVQGIRYR